MFGFLSRVQGPSVRATKQIVDMAERFNQLAVIAYRVLGKGPKAPPVSALKNVVNYVPTKDVDVTSPSQLIDGTQ